MEFIAFIVLSVTVVLITYGYFKTKFSYWSDRNVPFIPPRIPLGNLQAGRNRLHSAHLMQKYYNALKGKGPFGGIYFFMKPVVLALDLEFIKNVLIKDFNYFQSRGVYYNERDDPISCHLFAIDGQKWRTLRSRLTPTFSSGKMKFMFPTILNVAEEFRQCINDQLEGGANILELKDILARFTTDVIGTVAFGIECNSLKNPDAEFLHMGQRAFRVSRVKQSFMTTFKSIARFLHMKTLNQDVSNFFMKIVKETVEFREANNIKRNDFMDLLIQLKNKGTVEDHPSEFVDKLSLNEIAAQTFVFFLAGFETSSTTLTYCLYELSLNQEIQDRGRQEVKEVLKKYNGQFTYEAISEMHYLGQIIYESLRKYPPGAILVRMANQNYNIPDTEITLNKGSLVIIPVYAIHHDSKFYPEPEIFNPDRFDSNQIAKRCPESYLPFGEGPRNCIGMRFGIMQAKIGLAISLKYFKFSVCSKTEIPSTFSTKNIILTPANGLWLNVTSTGDANKKFAEFLWDHLKEILRKYPPASNLIRMVTKDYNVPETSHILPKDSLILIPAFAIHYDPDLYPNPMEFNPDRFTMEEMKKRHPCSYLPFGEGPRNCIGIRFGVLQAKIGMAILLNSFLFDQCSKTTIPLEFQTNSILLAMRGGLWLSVKKFC